MKKFLEKHPIINKIKYEILISFVVLFSLIIDLVSKVLTDGISVNVIGDFLKFVSVHNYGAAYGIFSGKSIGLIIVTSIILILILVYNYFHKNKTVFYSISMGLIIGGAIGNLIDRICLGYVRDFIKFSFFSFTCNFADICLTFGVILFVVYLLFFEMKANKKQKNNKDNVKQKSSLLNIENKEEKNLDTKSSGDDKNE